MLSLPDNWPHQNRSSRAYRSQALRRDIGQAHSALENLHRCLEKLYERAWKLDENWDVARNLCDATDHLKITLDYLDAIRLRRLRKLMNS